MILYNLDEEFLKAQSDEWILNLYEFLNGQSALRDRLEDLALIRLLKDGTHVTARSNDQPLAFLPGPIETAFPTVRAAVCASDEAMKFLQSLGLTEPDLVDDVVRNVLPKYGTESVDVADADYEADISRILSAFGTDSEIQHEKLVKALGNSCFIKAVDCGGAKIWAKPGDGYLATERLKNLFSSVSGVLLVDDSYACLKGEDIREMLEACGAIPYLRLRSDYSLSRAPRSPECSYPMSPYIRTTKSKTSTDWINRPEWRWRRKRFSLS
ncbi:MAG: hypothetical protein J7M19_05515 [Planctomycetes bacterium]|nr:hypothetical protein [Planctomycetota bacterium]